MKANRMLRTLCAMLALVIALSVPTMGLAVDAPAIAKAVKPTAVTLDITEKTILPGQKVTLTQTVEPADASQNVTWKSSKTSIATVSSKGVVTGKATGTAKITATTKTGGKKATCVIRVSKQFEGVNVHFYGIGNSSYQSIGSLPACAYDLANMKYLYSGATFGGKSASVKGFSNQTAEGIESVLNEMANDPTIGEDDITIFYYSGHGAGLDWPATYHGALVGIDATSSSYAGMVSVNTVQSYLDRVKGNVVVILDSCFSGQFISFKDADGSASVQASINAANNAWISSLSRSRATNYSGKALPDSAKKNKYFILTASSNAQTSTALTTSSSAFSLFTQAFYEYILKTKSGQTKSLSTVYSNVSKKVNEFKKTWNKRYPKNKIVQVTKAWPGGSKFPIFAWN